MIHPPPPDTPELGKFRGEPVYPRSSVILLKTAETWMRTEGRLVKPGCQPLKTIKARPGTVNRQRELEVLKEELRNAGEPSDGDVMQGLYARSQTEPYVPEPIYDVSPSELPLHLKVTDINYTWFPRVKSPRITLEISICMSPVCYQRAQSIFPVSNPSSVVAFLLRS